MNDASTFQLRVGKEIALPTGFDISDSLRQDTLTPKIIAMYREEGSQNCHFSRTLEMMAFTERFGLFVTDGVKPGDVIHIMWVDKKCACGIPVELINPGRRFTAWSYDRDSSSDLAKLREPDLIELVKRQTDLIPTVGLQLGCAIFIKERDAYQTGMLHHGIYEKMGYKVGGPIIIDHVSELSSEKATVATCLKSDGEREDGGYIIVPRGDFRPATDEEITKLVTMRYSTKWGFM